MPSHRQTADAMAKSPQSIPPDRRCMSLKSMFICVLFVLNVRIEICSIHCLHDFALKQDSQLNSSVLFTVWRVVIEM